MARRLHNWNYGNVTEFLKKNGFNFLKELAGSHEHWIKYAEGDAPDRIVEVNFTHRSYPVKTLKAMIRRSGIHQDKWIRWAGQNPETFLQPLLLQQQVLFACLEHGLDRLLFHGQNTPLLF